MKMRFYEVERKDGKRLYEACRKKSSPTKPINQNEFYKLFQDDLTRTITLRPGMSVEDTAIEEGIDLRSESDRMYIEFLVYFWGKKHFILNEGIPELLLETDPSSVPVNMIRFPFPAFRIVSSDRNLISLIHSLPVTGDNSDPGFTMPDVLHCLDVVHFSEKKINQFIVSFQARQSKELGPGHRAGTCGIFEWETDSQETVGYWSSHTSTEMTKAMEKYNKQESLSAIDVHKKINLFVINLLLYLGSSKSDVRRTPEEQRIRDQAKNAKGKERHKLEYIAKQLANARDVGGRIDISQKDVEAIRDLAGTESGRKLLHRHIVRGHFRNQAYGKGLLERKLMWIMPYWKGPDLAELINKKYEMRINERAQKWKANFH